MKKKSRAISLHRGSNRLLSPVWELLLTSPLMTPSNGIPMCFRSDLVRSPDWLLHQAIRETILTVVPQQQPGIPFKTLPALVVEQLSDDIKEKLGSVSWHTTTVKLNMEVEGELSRVPNVKPQHLVRA